MTYRKREICGVGEMKNETKDENKQDFHGKISHKLKLGLMMQENYPILMSRKSLKSEHDHLKKICITSDNFTLGRNLQNSVVVPVISISRKHCTFIKSDENEWSIEDHSSGGVEINGMKLGKGASKKLSHEDTIVLDPIHEFVYRFIIPSCDALEIPRKRTKTEPNSSQETMIENMKTKFEESQSYEMKHIESKIQSAKQMQNTSKILKEQLQLDMARKIQQLENNFAVQIENLKGEKNEVEQQKALLLEERDLQLATVKTEMEGKIAELMEQIKKHNESESELLKENNLLKAKLLKEREEFLSELSRESSSKQDLLDKLEARIREQDEVRKREKQELEHMLRKETEQLRLAKEKELKELEEQKRQREWELVEEINSLKRYLDEQAEQTEQQRLRAEQQLSEQMEQMKKLSDEDKAKMTQLIREREEIQIKLKEAEINAEKTHEDLKAKVKAREVDLLASKRIQQQAEKSNVVINSLQEQLERVKAQLQSVETEKNSLLSNFAVPEPLEVSSKESFLAEVGELMDSELQCSICAEQFVGATTLNCSHTFCKYCITMWKKKKKDCPICRTPITSEVKNLVLDSFIDKMAQNLTEDVKKKREEILKFREEQIAEDAQKAQSTPATMTNSRRRRNNRNTRVSASRTTTNPIIMTTATGRPGYRGATGAVTVIPTVDLTGIPLTRAPLVPPRAIAPAMPPRAVPPPQLPGAAPPIMITRLPLPLQQIQVYRMIQQNGQTLMVPDNGHGGGTSSASVAPTTAATDAASAAARAATGPLAAPSGRHQ